MLTPVVTELSRVTAHPTPQIRRPVPPRRYAGSLLGGIS
jgi:hypothetical protein